MKALILTVERWTTRLALLLACLMLVVASSLGVFQIVTRFVLEQPAEWSEVLIRFSLIWMVFFGVPTAFRQGAMVSVDALYRYVPAPAKRVLDVVVALAALTLMLIILWWGYDYAVRGRVQTMAGLEELSMFWAYIAMPVGAVFSILAIVANTLDPRRMELETAQ
jgi:TRAP-type C4-dicarboxylate transport system permease small subunit